VFSSLLRVGKESLFWQALKMLLTFVLLVFLLSFLLFLKKKPRLSAFVLFLAILVTGLLGSGPVTQSALDSIQTFPPQLQPQWKESNIIFVLGSGQARWTADYVSPQIIANSRLLQAIKLYQSCKKSNASASCTVLASGGDPSQSGEAEALTMARELKLAGVAEGDVMSEPESRDTYENARNSAKLIEGHRYDTMTLVTSGFHMKRSEICFQLNGISVLAAPSDRLRAISVPYPHAANLYYINLVAHEYAGIIKAYLIKLTGFNL
jgi:uncharacterized SAM-binding protein YcdF (DUF218 family)